MENWFITTVKSKDLKRIAAMLEDIELLTVNIEQSMKVSNKSQWCTWTHSPDIITADTFIEYWKRRETEFV